MMQALETTLYNEKCEQLYLVYPRETNHFKIQGIHYPLESLHLE